MSPRPYAYPLFVVATSLCLIGCPAKSPPPVAPPAISAATPTADTGAAATATAEAAKAAADLEAASRAAAAAAIAQAEKDVASAREAKAPLFAFEPYQSAVELLTAAKASFSKPAFATARGEAEAASAKAKEARERALAAKAGSRHEVKRGQTLWGIAKLKLSDPFLWPILYKANLDLIRDPNRIDVRQEFSIPDRFAPEEAEEARKAAAEAPGPK